jgi:glutathione S-transferase
MSAPVLFGAEYSVYTRIARLALMAKGVEHQFEIVDVFDRAADRSRHPFGKIPVLEHDGFRLYEAGAIGRYVDEAFAGPALQPDDARGRARVAQVVSVLDSYAFQPMVLELYIQRVSRKVPDEARIAAALAPAGRVLDALEELAKTGVFGAEIGLAEAHFVPILAYFSLATEGTALLSARPLLAAWWACIRMHPHVVATRFPAEMGLSR